jgi:hypothetical protein
MKKSAYVIERGLKQSLESVDNGLKRFLLSLQQARMTEGIQGYRSLGMVLIQQRLWAHSHARTQLVPLFRSIAKTAGELHRIFSAYAEVMKPLKDLDRLTSLSVAGAAPPEEAPPSGALDGAAAMPEAPDPQHVSDPGDIDGGLEESSEHHIKLPR